MLNPNIYKSQAEYWKNLPIIDRSIKACATWKMKKTYSSGIQYYKSVMLANTFIYLTARAKRGMTHMDVNNV